jgi:hypothetical protein
LDAEVDKISEDGWRARKEAWQKEVNNEAEKLRQNSNNGNEVEMEKELVAKRIAELRHAQELAQMYQMKMRRIDKMTRELNKCLQVSLILFSFIMTCCLGCG